MSSVAQVPVPAPSITAKDIYDRQVAATETTKPSLFSMKAQMLEQGRTDTVLACTEDLSVRLKVYASGGENELHAHPSEDHVFVIMQGSARFYGPDGEIQDVVRNQGFMMPRGMLYRFHATSTDECLVMLRIGTPNFQKQDRDDRLGRDGKPLVGDSKENKQVPVIFRDGVYFGD
jgi:mannose-6-phosphate isomerase-like protein (cupin superfamily)